MYLSLNYFEFNKKKRKTYKIKNKSTAFDNFAIKLLLEHIEASNYLYSDKVKSKKKRKINKSNLLKKEDIQFLKEKYTLYAASKYSDEKEHQENINAVKLKKNRDFYEFKNVYNKLNPPPKDSKLYPVYIRDYHDHSLYLGGFNLAYDESIPYNKELHKMNLSLIDKKKSYSIEYMERIINQALKVFDKKEVRENPEFLNAFVKNFKSMGRKKTKELESSLKDMKLNENKVSSLIKKPKLKFEIFIDEYIKAVGPIEKEPKTNTKLLIKIFKYFSK